MTRSKHADGEFCFESVLVRISPFHVIGLFLYPLKTENQSLKRESNTGVFL